MRFILNYCKMYTYTQVTSQNEIHYMYYICSSKTVSRNTKIMRLS